MSDDRTVIEVGGPSSYPVVVAAGARDGVAEFVAPSGAVAVVRPDSLTSIAAPVVAALRDAGHRVVETSLPDGEDAKTVETLTHLWEAFADAHITRTDVVVAVGGGATTDVVGFAAATWLRGVPVVHVPTTLLGMVDAAVGGKTAVNTGAGKNLVGAFHPPAAVVVDLDVLRGLPQPEWVNGMAEVVKAGFISDPVILDLIEKDPQAAATPDGSATRELVERAIRVKVDVVSQDLRETGLREMLNYGHTLGHAIERVEHYQWPHGHAVAVGMVFAAELGRTAGLNDDIARRHRDVLDALGLPTSYRGADRAALVDTMRHDKKARGDRLRFVVLEELAKPRILADPEPHQLDAAFSAVAA